VRGLLTQCQGHYGFGYAMVRNEFLNFDMEILIGKDLVYRSLLMVYLELVIMASTRIRMHLLLAVDVSIPPYFLRLSLSHWPNSDLPSQSWIPDLPLQLVEHLHLNYC
jgi:hypothetical protein